MITKRICCQFCGRYPKLSKVMGEYKYSCHISCPNPCGTSGDWHTTKNNAARAWNTRATGKSEYTNPGVHYNPPSGYMVRNMADGVSYKTWPKNSRRHRILRAAGYTSLCKGWNRREGEI